MMAVLVILIFHNPKDIEEEGSRKQKNGSRIDIQFLKKIKYTI